MSESEADPFMPRTIQSMIPKGRSVLPRGGGLSNEPVSYARTTTNFLKGRGSISGPGLLATGGSLPKGHSVLIPGGGMIGTSLFKMKHYDPYASIEESPIIEVSESGIVGVQLDPRTVNKGTRKRTEEEALKKAKEQATPITDFKKKMGKAKPETVKKIMEWIRPTPPTGQQRRNFRQNFAMETPENVTVTEEVKSVSPEQNKQLKFSSSESDTEPITKTKRKSPEDEEKYGHDELPGKPLSDKELNETVAGLELNEALGSYDTYVSKINKIINESDGIEKTFDPKSKSKVWVVVSNEGKVHKGNGDQMKTKLNKVGVTYQIKKGQNEVKIFDKHELGQAFLLSKEMLTKVLDVNEKQLNNMSDNDLETRLLMLEFPNAPSEKKKKKKKSKEIVKK